MEPVKLLILAAAVGILACGADAPRAEGDWLGKLSVNGIDLRIALHLKQTGAGLTGVLDSLDQGAPGIPLGKVQLTGNKLTLQVPAVQGAYEGTLADGGDSIAGTWSQGGNLLPLTFKRTAGPTTLNRPQEPKPPFPYAAEDVGYDNPQAAGVHLAGTFTHPKGSGPFPAVLLITGSGQQNRNEEIFGHKPFLLIADYLTRRGIAVLRVDDRGAGGSTGVFAASTTADFATDVAAGVGYLRQRPDVDKRHIGLIGHSEGGVIAPMVAAKMPEVGFIVLLAGTGLPGDQIIAGQTFRLSVLAGASSEKAAESREFESRLLKIVKSEPDAALREKKVLALADGKPDLEAKLKQGIPALNSPWYRYFLAYDPRPVLAKVQCPVLALSGARDAQVDAQQNIPAIQAALAAGGNQDVTTRIIAGVNHLFQECATGAISEYGTIEQTMSPQVLEIIASWVQRHVTAP